MSKTLIAVAYEDLVQLIGQEVVKNLLLRAELDRRPVSAPEPVTENEGREDVPPGPEGPAVR